MITKCPINDWCEQFEPIEDDVESLSEFDDENDFSDYLWMENEEEFDKNELQRLEEEYLMNECIEAMLQDEIEAEFNELQEEQLDQLDKAVYKLSVLDRNLENSLKKLDLGEEIEAELNELQKEKSNQLGKAVHSLAVLEDNLDNSLRKLDLREKLEAELDELQEERDDLEKAVCSWAVLEHKVKNSLLNPLADEFIPQNLILDLGKS